MAATDLSDQAAADHTQPHVNTPRPPWYARVATTAGRPAVLTATLIMSMPGEYHVARFAGWTDPWAYGMPFSLSAYAGIAAVVSAVRPKGARGRVSAMVGAAFAILLALAAQVVAHLVGTGHMNGNQGWLIAITSMIPPAVLAHLLHLAATPVGTPATQVSAASEAQLTPVVERVSAPTTPPVSAPPAIPPMPPTPPALAPAPIVYSDPCCAAIRPLYNHGTRPGTAAMRAAITAAGLTPPSDSTIRGRIRGEVETHERHLATLPAAIAS